MCRELVARAVEDERMLKVLRIPERFWTFIAASWKRGDPSLYGRFDLSYDGSGPAKLLEYNADTPTSVFETAVFQWMWLEDAKARAITPQDADQYNSLHERLIESWKEVAKGQHLHLAGALDDPEDGGTVAYLEDTARQAGLETTRASDGGHRPHADAAASSIRTTGPSSSSSSSILGNGCSASSSALTLQARRRAGSSRHGRRSCPTRASCRCCGRCSRATRTCCRPISRTTRRRPSSATPSCASRSIRARARTSPWWSAGNAVDQGEGPYGAEGFVRQAVATLPKFQDNYAAIGSWIAGGQALRPFGARGTRPDHQEHLAIPAPRDCRVRHSRTAQLTAVKFVYGFRQPHEFSAQIRFRQAARRRSFARRPEARTGTRQEAG